MFISTHDYILSNRIKRPDSWCCACIWSGSPTERHLFLPKTLDSASVSFPHHLVSLGHGIRKAARIHKVYLTIILRDRAEYRLLFFSWLVSGRNSPNPAIWLVPGAGGNFRSCPLTERFRPASSLCFHFAARRTNSLKFCCPKLM